MIISGGRPAALLTSLVVACCPCLARAAPTFTGLYQTYDSSIAQLTSSSVARMTASGPVPGTRIDLPLSLSDITIDPGGSGYYGEIAQSVYQIDPATLQATELTVAAPAYLGWPVGVTFDTARSRLVLATLEGEGFLFAYSPQSRAWSYINSLNNVDFQSIVYRPSDDTLYALPNNGGGSLVQDLYKYAADDGRFLGTIPIQYPLALALTYGDGGYQLLLRDDDQLAVITPPIDGQQRLYFIDPATGAIGYDQPFPVPEPAGATLLALGALHMLLKRQRRRARPHRRDP